MNRRARMITIVAMAAFIFWSKPVIAVGSTSEAPVAGCEPAPSRAPTPAAGATSVSPLADTQWRLVEFQSMDDAVGTVRPDDPSRYTMRLNGNGTVALRLNCNRASGTWSAEPSADRASGRFEFGPLAGARASCPPPSLDEQVSLQAQYVRSYLLKDGRLYLGLMADGGVYVWEPCGGEPFQTKPDKDLEAAIRRALPYYTRKVVDMEGGTGRGRYVYGRVDLNGDGREEVFVYLLGSIFCGTGGCNLLLFTQTRSGYSLINNFPISRLPVIVSVRRTQGWHDLVRLESGVGVEASYVRHAFDGRRYVNRERMPADKAPEGKSYLTGELSFDKGALGDALYILYLLMILGALGDALYILYLLMILNMAEGYHPRLTRFIYSSKAAMFLWLASCAIC